MINPDTKRAYDYLLGLPRFAVEGSAAYKPGLDRMRALLTTADDPHRRYPCVHVAGTNGKGSVASMTASILTAAGKLVGLHTSPHLHSLEERMRINGAPASPDWVAGAVGRFRGPLEDVGASFFEATVLLSFLYFAEFGVDIGVVEVGLGGRYDATNVIRPEVSVITDISLEHTDILGSTLTGIAAEKAGIIKAGIPAITTAKGAAFDTIAEAARAVESDIENVRRSCSVKSVDVRLTESRIELETPERRYDDLKIGLPGQHQIWNAVVAVRIVELLSRDSEIDVSKDAIRSGLANVGRNAGFMGRLSTLSRQPLIVADVAHNTQGIDAVLKHLAAYSSGRLHVAIGLMKDKDAEGIARSLVASGASVSVVPIDADRAIDPAGFASLLKRSGLRVDIQGSVSHVLDRFRQTADAHDVLLLTGSHHIAASALEAVRTSD